jgi:hypothetical protein
MKAMKIKLLVTLGALFLSFIALLLFMTIVFAEEDDTTSSREITVNTYNLSEEVLSHKPTVEKYCKKYGIEEYISYILAIMQVESGGLGEDVMQASESLGLSPNSLSLEESIEQGCKYFSELLTSANTRGMDIDAVIQSYNYGSGFLNYIETRGKKYSYELAESFAKEKAEGVMVDYPNPVAIPINGGKRYNYGNQFYKLLVDQYLITTRFDDISVQTIMDEALKYQGWNYRFGGASPATSFDCSGLVQWCYAKAGIHLPRVAQVQYDATRHIPLSEAKAGDLVFFHSTYDAGTYVTHVGIVIDATTMYHAGSDGIGYANLNDLYWQSHLIGAGRVINK